MNRRTDRQTDRRADGQTDRQGDSYISPNFVCGGIMINMYNPANPLVVNIYISVRLQID